MNRSQNLRVQESECIIKERDNEFKSFILRLKLLRHWICGYNIYKHMLYSLFAKSKEWMRLKIKSEKFVNTRIILATQIHMAFQRSLLNCFEEVEKIILSYQAKDLVHALPQILETFFNFDGTSPDEMNFGRLTSFQSYEYEVARRFFGLESPLVSLITKLSTDPSCFTLYEFPFTHLPTPTRNSIIVGKIPSFYSSRLKFSATGVPESVMLDAFDLYMFHFAFYIVNPHNWKIMHMIREPSYRSEWIYLTLFMSYLNAFFPTSPDLLPVKISKIQPSLVLSSHRMDATGNFAGSFCRVLDVNTRFSPLSSPNRSADQMSPNVNFLQQPVSPFQQHQHHSVDPFQQPQRQSFSPTGLPSSPPRVGHPTPPRVSRLLKLDPQLMAQLDSSSRVEMSASEGFASCTANTGLQGDLFVGSDFFLQIFADFWLNQFDSSTLEQHVWLTNKMLKVEDFLLVVRVLVKHLHLFANSAFEDSGVRDSVLGSWGGQSPGYVSTSSQVFVRNVAPLQQQQMQNLPITKEQREWNEFKRGIWSPWLCLRLYNFLKYHFAYGPLERPILEIWLSFIQPWRYTTVAAAQNGQESPFNTPQGSPQRQQARDGEKVLGDKWIPFIKRHLLFYTTFFKSLLNRSLCLDFTSTGNSFLFGRVAKVFSIRGLREAIQEVEMSLDPNVSASLNVTGSYLEYIRPSLGIYKALVSELEGENFVYVALFSNETKAQVIRLVSNILIAKENLENQLIAARLELSKRTWFQRISSMFQWDDDSALITSMDKNIDQLLVSANHFLVFFEIPTSALPRLPVPTWNQRTSASWSPSGNLSPEEQSLHQQLEAMKNLPDMKAEDDGTYRLTALGRHEILMKKKKLELEYKGDPDLQPIRSFEVAFLVTFFHNLCMSINNRYSREIQRATERPGLQGVLARYLFCHPEFDSGPSAPADPGACRLMQADHHRGTMMPRHRTNGFVAGKSSSDRIKLIMSPKGVLTNKLESRPPRLSLRFLARYSSLLFISLTLLVVKIWLGLDLIGVFIVFGIFVLACVTLVSRIIITCSEVPDDPVRRSPFPSGVGN